MAFRHNRSRAVSPALLGAALLAALAIVVCVSGCKADADTQTAPPAAEADTQRALQAAADFLGLPPTDLRLDDVIREPWRDRYRIIFAEYREIDVVMPECKVLRADLSEDWTKAHGEELLGPIDDEAVARGIADRFVAKHYLPLPQDWSAVYDDTPRASAQFFDYRWSLCYKGVRVSGAWYGVSVSGKLGRVNLCTSSFMPVNVSLTPKLSEEQGKAVVDTELKRLGLYDKPRRRLQHCWLEVGYYPRDAAPTARKQRLVWRIDYEFPYSEAYLNKQDKERRRALELGPPAAWFIVDAQSGEVLHRLVRTEPEEDPPPPPH